MGLTQANENLSIDVTKLLFRLLICNLSTLNIIPCRAPCLRLVIEKDETKHLSQLPVLANEPGSCLHFQWASVRSYPKMHCFAFSPLCTFLQLHVLAFTLHWTAPADLSRRAQSCGIPSAAEDSQPEPWAVSRGRQCVPIQGQAVCPKSRLWDAKSS